MMFWRKKKERYFIVYYVAYNKDKEQRGFVSVKYKNGQYVNHKISNDIGQPSGIPADKVAIINIIELNESDYNDFIL